MSAALPEWARSALLTRHYAGLAGLLAQFLYGPEKDGPQLTPEKAAAIITSVFGRASRCTYGGLAIVGYDVLQTAVRAETGETISVTEAIAFKDALGQLRITQPVCANGHLPARFTGPTSFLFQGTDQQCPLCRARVTDPDPTEFLLIWPERRLGHRAEKEVSGSDGRLVPTTADGILAIIGAPHAWFQKPVEGVTPSLEEIAMVLMHGMAKGVDAIPNGMDVLEALRDPRSARLDEWRCESVLRAARHSWRAARNPFVAAPTTSAPPLGPMRTLPPADGGSTLSGNRSEQLIQIMSAVFTGGIPQLQAFAERATGIAADNIMRWNLTNSAAVGALVRALEQANLLGTRFFDALEAAAPHRRGDINRVRAQWVVEVEQVHFDEMALMQNAFEHVYMQELFLSCFRAPMDLHQFWVGLFPHNQAHYNNGGRTIQDVAFGIGHMMGQARWSGERARYARLWPALEALNPDKRNWIEAVRKHYEKG